MNGVFDENEEEEDFEDIDFIFLVEFLVLEFYGKFVVFSVRKVGCEWVYMVDINRLMFNFQELVLDLVREWLFEFDNF